MTIFSWMSYNLMLSFLNCEIFYFQVHVGHQYHFHLETHRALCIPGEEGCMVVYSSTQNPSLVHDSLTFSKIPYHQLCLWPITFYHALVYLGSTMCICSIELSTAQDNSRFTNPSEFFFSFSFFPFSLQNFRKYPWNF